MSTVIQQYTSDFGITYVQTSDLLGIEFNFSHVPTQAEVDATVANFIAMQTPIVQVNLVAEDGTTI